MSDPSMTSDARDAVISAALELFARQGYEATSVDQIARAAGISRSTFFRQFGGKDDVVFADHEHLLEQLRVFLDRPHENPWEAVCEASQIVYRHYLADPELARRRYAIVRGVPTLRDQEIVTVFRYERLFDEYLRQALPGIAPIDAVTFAAAVTAVHNHVLRRLLRSPKKIPLSVLREAMDDLLVRFGVSSQPAQDADDDIVVAVFPRRTPLAEVTRRLRNSI